MTKIRHSAIAGSWYPGNGKQLRDEINLLLELTKPAEQIENIFGLVSPHAGYRYSGKTAAYAYNHVNKKVFDKVIVLSPSHREYFRGITIFSGDAYQTPLGEVKVNIKMRDTLSEASELIKIGDEGHSVDEHALEIQLPFLQVVLGQFEIIPIVIGDQNKKNVFELGEKIADLKDDKTLVVASTDLSHFHDKPEAEELDSIVINKIAEFDYSGLQNSLDRNNCEACGGGAVVALMKAAEIAGYKKSKVLHKTDSGEITGDNSGVVGYMSAVIYK